MDVSRKGVTRHAHDHPVPGAAKTLLCLKSQPPWAVVGDHCIFRVGSALWMTGPLTYADEVAEGCGP